MNKGPLKIKRFPVLHPLLTKVNQSEVKDTGDYRNGPVVVCPRNRIRTRERKTVLACLDC